MFSVVLAEIIEGRDLMPALWTATTAGLCCAIAQGLFTLLFARMPGFWSQKPAFVAHQLVALPLMLYVAYLGCAGWSRPAPPTVADRVFGLDPIGAHLVAVLLGALLLWDIPMTLVPSIYSPTALAHHVGLAALAALCLLPFMQYYAPFFGGIVEISSVPLQFVDFFHPRHFQHLLTGRPALSTLNAIARATFALSFLVVRTFWFPIVVVTGVVPDLLALASGSGGRPALAAVGIGGALAFTALQEYWSWLLLRQLAKALFAGSKDDEMAPAAADSTPYQQLAEKRGKR